MAKIVQEDPFFSGAVSVSGEAMAFMKLCMEKESRKRPTVKELLRHDFLTGGKISKRDNDR
jgi:serine/threonine protein kinase